MPGYGIGAHYREPGILYSDGSQSRDQDAYSDPVSVSMPCKILPPAVIWSRSRSRSIFAEPELESKVPVHLFEAGDEAGTVQSFCPCYGFRL